MSRTRYQFELAESAQEIRAYFALRRAIFCEEQGIFTGHDVDEIDQLAYPIVALDTEAKTTDAVAGVVRIYESEPNLWYGGRLGVHVDYRRVGRIGKGLIYKAVTTAHGWGCTKFLATVQLQNVRFFKRQHWHSLEEISICDRPHHLMEADLDFYPPAVNVRPVLDLSMLQVS
ncbi:MAG: MSMEG_0567/Sll0786 family nitrogen starvation N-acetyltransferase [Limnothrix sp.]